MTQTAHGGAAVGAPGADAPSGRRRPGRRRRNPAAAQPAPDTTRRRRPAGEIGLVGAVLLLALSVAALTPVAIVSLARYLGSRMQTETVYRTTPPLEAGRPSHALLHSQLLKLDELGRSVTLRMSGNHVCNPCSEQLRVVFYSLPPEGVGRAGQPPSAAITLPASAQQVTQDIVLPIAGDLITYPFDRYRFRVGVVLQTFPAEADESAAVDVPPPAAAGRLYLTLEEVVPQVDVGRLRTLDPVVAGTTPPDDAVQGRAPPYLGVVDISFERPAYLKVLVVLVVTLVAIGAFYATWLNPVGELLTKTGALVLGVWGVRSLLLNPYPPHSTTVDALLTLVIFFVLAAVLMRALYQLHDRAGLHLLPGRRHRRDSPPPAPPFPAVPGRRRRVRRPS